MNNILATATVLTPIVVAFSSVLKQYLVSSKYLPIINIIIGVGLATLYAVSFHESEIVFLWAGALAGLAAGGFYDIGKNLKGDGKK